MPNIETAVRYDPQQEDTKYMARASNYEPLKESVLDALHVAYLRHSKPPTVRDLAETVQVGVATMHLYLKKLAEEGLVEWSEGRHRSLKITQAGLDLLRAAS